VNRVFFTYRDLLKQFPSILLEAGLNVERHLDHVVHDTQDEDWLREVYSRGWIAMTHGRNIRYKPNELNAVIRHRVALLVTIGDARYADLAIYFC
jgi:hypothetical protein